jgi:DnaJ-class molecular chaperone
VSLVMANDSYSDLEDNLHALASSIEALRRIERYGSSDLLERAFRGFKALPETAGGFKWWEVLGVSMNATEEQVQEAFRVKVKTAHPDNGGSAEEFNNVTRAREMALAGLKKE